MVYNISPLFSRREFMKTNLAGVAGATALACVSVTGDSAEDDRAKIVVFMTQDRKEGVRTVLDTLDYAPVSGKRVLIKPNFNTADAAPGSTHNDTLAELIRQFDTRGGEDITIGESSGPPATGTVLEQKGIYNMADELGATVVNYENLTEEDWVHFDPAGNHWNGGFSVPKMAAEAEFFVSTCCLKTHGFGGVFTMSLKLAVGLTPKSIRSGMHGNSTDMRRMITEINLGYKPDLIVMDGIETFTDGGPMSGTRKPGNVFIGGTDRVAVDAVGLAVLKDLGSNEAIMGRKIFEQEQIARAVELGIGIHSADRIELVTPDAASAEYAKKLTDILATS